MRLAAALDQTGRLFDGFAKPDVPVRYTKHGTARLVVFDDLKSKAHRIESSGEYGFMAKRFEFRHLHPRCRHKKSLCTISAAEPDLVSKIAMQSTYRVDAMLLSTEMF